MSGFVDEAQLNVRGGDGGAGCVAFRREGPVAFGGPNGGDGGKGGDVILRGDDDTNNLVDFKFKPHWRAERGGHGLGKDCAGREGKSAILRVPLGTVVTNAESGALVAEVIADGQEIVICQGGKVCRLLLASA